MSELLKKYESIDQSKLNEATIKILNRVKTITTDFTAEDPKNNKIADDVMNEILKKNPDAVRIVKREPKAKPAPKKTHKASHTAKGKRSTKSTPKPATVSSPKGSSNNIMSVAKEIQKEGESWKDAVERAKVVLKERKEQGVEKKKSELQKLLELVRTKKELKGFANSDIDRDSRRVALPRGRRVSENGNVYYENRENRTDRLAPNYPQDMPLLEKGGDLTLYKIQMKYKYDLQPKWEDEKFQTGGRKFLTFAQAQDFKKKLQGLSSSMEYKVVKVGENEKLANGGDVDSIKSGDRIIITTTSLGKDYVGMRGFITDRKLLNNKYSVKLANGLEMAFDRSEFKHDSINPKYNNGGAVPQERMYNFLKDDLAELEEAINEGNNEEVERFFSYWLGSSGHLKSLETKNNERMYNFLKDDLEKLMEAVENDDTEEVERFFSYWGQHLESLKMANGGGLDDYKLELYDMDYAFVSSNKLLDLKRNYSDEIKNKGFRVFELPNFHPDYKRGNKYGLFKPKKSFANGGAFAPNVSNGTQFMNGVYEKGGIFYKEGSNKYGLGNTEIFVQEENDMYCVYDNVYNNESKNWEIKKLADFDTMDEAKEFAIEHSKKEYANGGSLPYMTDPNFGDFQNTGSFELGGSVQDDLKKRMSWADNKAKATGDVYLVLQHKKDKSEIVGIKKQDYTNGITDYKDWNVVYFAEKENFELGGAFMTDLAGHTGGSLGTGNQTPLSGFSGTNYTGLVGETGAMSSGELFMDGGAMMSNQQVINDASQPYVITEAFGNPAQHLAKGGAIKNQYEGRTADDIWNNLTESQRLHFLTDHNKSEIQSTDFSLEQFSKKKYSFLSEKAKKSFNKHIETGQYAKGGELKGKFLAEIKVPYNYESVVKDEFEFTEFLSKALTKKWFGNGVWGVTIVKQLFEKDYSQRIVVQIEIPVGVTQGGGLDKFDFEEFISKTLTKKWFGNGYWGVYIVSSYANGGFMDNVYFADGGAINGMLNKKIQKLAEKKGLTIDALGRDEYNKVMTQALVESLTDANYHAEAKQVVVKAEGKTKWSDDLYRAESFNPDEKVTSFAREVATECAWTGDDILNAYYFITKMEGSKVASMIDDLFLNPKSTKSVFTGTVEFNIGDVVWQKDEKRYAIVMNNYGDAINGDGGDIRLDTTGNTNIFTYDKEYKNTGYNLVKLGEKGDTGKFTPEVLTEMKESANRLIDLRRQSKDKEGVSYYQEVYKRLLDGEFDSMTEGKTSSSSSKPTKYIDHADIEKVTVKYKGKEVSFKGEDVLNGANLMEDGGDLSKIAFYISKRDVIDVTLKDGSKIKPMNGYWVKKGSQPISTPSTTPKKPSASGARFKFDIGDKVMINDSGYVTSFSEFDLSKPAEIIDRSTTKMGGKTYYFYKVKMADGRIAYNQAEQSKLTLVEKGSFADGGFMNNVYADGGFLSSSQIEKLDEGFTIPQLNAMLDEMFPYSFGFEVWKQEQSSSRSSKFSYDYENQVKDDKLKLYFYYEGYGRDLNYEVRQGQENTYFNFLLVDDKINTYVGGFGFKDKGDVDETYITKFVSFLHDAYHYSFQVRHSVMANGGFMNNVYADGGGVDDGWELRREGDGFGSILHNGKKVDDYEWDSDAMTFWVSNPMGGQKSIDTPQKLFNYYKAKGYADGGFMNDVYAKGGVIKIGDNVRSTVFKGRQGEVLSKGNSKEIGKKYYFVRLDERLPNGDYQHDIMWVDEVEKMANGGMFDDNDGFMKMDNNRAFRYPEKEVHVDIIDEPIDLTTNIDLRRKKVNVQTINDDIDLKDDNRLRAKLSYENRNRTPEKMMAVNQRMIITDLPMPKSSTHKND